MNRHDFSGLRFGRLAVIGPAHWDRKQRSRYWRCVCDCGNTHTVCGKRLRKGETKSCGCLRVDLGKIKTLTHGKHSQRVYRVWASMLSRCDNPSQESYRLYGGRGIKVCERWRKFENFYADMGDPPLRHSIDRIENDGNYEPTNCRWATAKEQRANQRAPNAIIKTL